LGAVAQGVRRQLARDQNDVVAANRRETGRRRLVGHPMANHPERSDVERQRHHAGGRSIEGPAQQRVPVDADVGRIVVRPGQVGMRPDRLVDHGGVERVHVVGAPEVEGRRDGKGIVEQSFVLLAFDQLVTPSSRPDGLADAGTRLAAAAPDEVAPQ
jgi:hypothetical protein